MMRNAMKTCVCVCVYVCVAFVRAEQTHNQKCHKDLASAGWSERVHRDGYSHWVTVLRKDDKKLVGRVVLEVKLQQEGLFLFFDRVSAQQLCVGCRGSKACDVLRLT